MDAANDREARAAVRAVGERVAEAAVGRIGDLPRGRRRRWPCPGRRAPGLAAVRAGDDPEAGLAGERHLARRDRLDAARAAPRWTAPYEAFDLRVAALGLGEHAALVVEHEARESSSLARRYTKAEPPPGPCPRPAPDRLTPPAPERMVHARLGLLDPRDLLGARNDHMVAQGVGRDRPRRRRRMRSSSARASRLDQRRDHAAGVAARRQRDQRVARAAVGDHLAREDRVGPDVVGERGDDRRILGEVERAPPRAAKSATTSVASVAEPPLPSANRVPPASSRARSSSAAAGSVSRPRSASAPGAPRSRRPSSDRPGDVGHHRLDIGLRSSRNG